MTEPDAPAARAIDRVLGAERESSATIAGCERVCAELLDHARQQRRVILERAQARIVALHTRAAKALELHTAAMIGQEHQSAARAVAQLADPARRAAAVERLAAHLTGTRQEPVRDGD